MATVFLAEDLKHRRQVAIKVLDRELAQLLGPERFLREIEIAAKLQHPHILPLLDSGAAGDLFYYVMPYVAGESLRQRLRTERQLGYDEALRLTSEVARALDYAHRQGIVHRDIKPENILLADGQAVVADFGIARAVSASGGDKLTGTGMVVGSPPYMSPEQIAGRQDVDGRSDLYSLGCTLYEMLAGQPPFTGPPETFAYQHLNLTPRAIRELRPTASPSLDATLARLLAKVPAERFESGAALAAALAGPLRGDAGSAGAPESGEAIESAPTIPSSRFAPSTRARGVWIGVALGAVALVVAGTMLWRLRSGDPQGVGRRWVWVASFAANGGDRATAEAVQELVAAALDQSKLVSTVPIEQVKIALRNSGRPDTASVSAELARELAYRSAILVVIDGKVARLGSTTTVTLRATSSEDGRVLASAAGSAASERELVPVVTRLAGDLRRGLGESSGIFMRSALWTDAPTPSFEAFKLYIRGRDLINANDPNAAIPILRRATGLDPEFATAWVGMGIAFANMGRLDSARTYQQRALRYPERLPMPRRLLAEAHLAEIVGDPSRAIQVYDEILHIDAAPVERATAMNNKANLLRGMPEQALELYRQSIALEPIAPTDITISNMTDVLIELRRLPEARDMARKIQGTIGPIYETELLLIDRSWDRVDSLVDAIQRRSTLPEGVKRRARVATASVRGARGRISDAVRIMEENERSAAAERNPRPAAIAWFAHSWLTRLAGRTTPREPEVLKGTTWSRAAAAVRAAEAGDSTRARIAVERWPDPAEKDEPSHRALRDHVEACLALRRGQWAAAVERLRENANGGERSLPKVESVLRTRSRWLVADAYDRLGRPDSAAAYLQLILEPPATETMHIFQRGLWEPFVRCRLVNSYASLGRVADARREWDAVVTTCTHPDPELRAKLDEARSALQAAQATWRGR
jgi:Tfp pilus assembly protein PilF